MFEKESQDYAMREVAPRQELYIKGRADIDADYEKVKKIWQDGAEFGYKKGQSDQLVHKQYQLNQLRKANEWHYVKDGDLPKATTPVLVILESGVPYVSWISSDKGWWFCTNYYTGEDKVIAWKEIVLPKEDIENA